MAGRNNPYLGPPRSHPALIDDPRVLHRQVQVQAQGRAHTAAVIEARQREIYALLHDNQRLAASHVALKQDLAAADQELRQLSSTAAAVKAETDARVREVHERSLRAEAELRSIDEQTAELAQVRADIQKMTADRKEFTAKLREINEELVMVRTEREQLPAVEAEIESMHKEIQRGRAAIEYEKKMQTVNLEQSQIMEKHVVSMAHEIEKLHVELANAEKRARAAAAATPGTGYAGVYAYSEAGYGVPLYSNPYTMPQVQGVIDGSPQYGAAGGLRHGPNGSYDMQHSNLQV